MGTIINFYEFDEVYQMHSLPKWDFCEIGLESLIQFPLI